MFKILIGSSTPVIMKYSVSPEVIPLLKSSSSPIIRGTSSSMIRGTSSSLLPSESLVESKSTPSSLSVAPQISYSIFPTTPLPVAPQISYNICSWNIDGLRDEVLPYIRTYLTVKRPHIFCLNETKRKREYLDLVFSEFKDHYTWIVNAHEPAHYHGVVMFIRKDVKYEEIKDVPFRCYPRSDNKSSDSKCGRLIMIRMFYSDSKFINIVSAYVPNSGHGGGDGVDPSKGILYRLIQWDPALNLLLNSLRKTSSTILIGDINLAPDEIDVSSPKSMISWAGFTPPERQSFYHNFIRDGHWVDIWRVQHPTHKCYTWRGYPKKPNLKYGMRLDSVIISSDLVKNTVTTWVQTEDCPADTDHVPIGISVKF